MIILETIVSASYWRDHSCGHADRFDCACEPTFVPESVRVRVRAGECERVIAASFAWDCGELLAGGK